MKKMIANIKKLLRLAAIGTAATSLSLVGVVEPVKAGTTNCGSLVWFGSYYPVRSKTIQLSNGRPLQIHLLNEQLSDDSHAELYWFQRGDRTWIDRSTDGTRTWFQCGPFKSNVSNEMNNVGVHMRACAASHDTRETFCTDWYYDKD